MTNSFIMITTSCASDEQECDAIIIRVCTYSDRLRGGLNVSSEQQKKKSIKINSFTIRVKTDYQYTCIYRLVNNWQ